MSASAYVPELHHPEPDTLPASSIEEATGSNGGIALSADYGGSAPTSTPTSEGAHTMDSETGQIWWYLDGVWQ